MRVHVKQLSGFTLKYILKASRVVVCDKETEREMRLKFNGLSLNSIKCCGGDALAFT